MRKADVAEWLLSLTTSPVRASSIAGDLAEQAPLHGQGWFWGSLIRTLASLVWRVFADAPFRMTWMALLGTLIQILWMLLAIVVIVTAHVTLIATLGLGSLEHYTDRESNPADPVWLLESCIAFAMASFLLGKWLAKRTPNQELAVYAVIWFIVHILWIPLNLLATGGGQAIPGPGDLIMDVVATILGILFTAAGVKRFQRRPALS